MSTSPCNEIVNQSGRQFPSCLNVLQPLLRCIPAFRQSAAHLWNQSFYLPLLTALPF